MSDSDGLEERLDGMTVGEDNGGTTFTTSNPMAAAAAAADAGGSGGGGAAAAAPAAVPTADPVPTTPAADGGLARYLGEKERRRSSAVKTQVGDNLALKNNSKVTKKMAKHGDSTIIFSDYVIKVNRRNKMQKRVLMISDSAIYNLDPANFQCKRRIPFSILGSISMSKLSDNFFALHIPSEYDYLMVSGKKVEIVDHVREQAKRATGKEIRVSLANSYDYRIDQDNVREIHFTKVEGGVSTQIYTKTSKK
eukprot:TRINITY_DN205_c1_g8_i1.p1 TRINITY_DN205_c1_g8~~TRINITY_DN205_c1_g8_i1.p1  ORF type:complete len:263 (-),score=111.22 TRINITY_DN205_c1_g8_i1:212-964(-)